MLRRLLHTGRRVGLGLLVACLVLCVLEGAASFLYFFRAWSHTPTVLAEQIHTEHDPELGWINLPSVARPDLYGAGRGLHTNKRRFRSLQETPVESPASVVRVVCSGDSFTLGYGVGDADTWPSQLEGRHPRIETVNMGQGGYGLGQAYLWYRREHTRLDHDVHILALVSWDFERARRKTFTGYPKPRMALQGSELVAEGVPLPETGGMAPWLSRHQGLLGELKLARGMHAVLKRLGSTEKMELLDLEASKQVMGAVLADLKRLNGAADSTLFIVYLPMFEDSVHCRPNPWRTWLADETGKQGINYVDLGSAFQSLPLDELHTLFIADGDVPYLGAAGHYTRQGNERVAHLLYDRLVAHPVIQKRLE